MKYKDFSPEIWHQIRLAITEAKQTTASPVAAFDADGTLWDTDIGENFFHFQIQKQLIPLPSSPWEHYLNLKKKNNDPREAYLWLAQICANVELSKVHEWAKLALATYSEVPLFMAQKKLISLFLSEGIRVFVITASVTWSVQPAASLLGLDYSSVLGVETFVKDGVITKIPHGEITYKEGKVKALLGATEGQKPFFACGKTVGDLNLLESATLLPLTVRATKPGHRIFEAENELESLARKRNWLHHSFA